MLYNLSKNNSVQQLTLESIELETSVSRQTLSRAINGKIVSVKESTARRLTEFIELESHGKITAKSLLEDPVPIFFPYSNMKGADLSGEDLSHHILIGGNLTGANLSGAKLDGAQLARCELRDAILDGAEGTHVDLIGANLDGASLVETNIRRWDLTGVSMDSTVVSGCHFSAPLYGADLSNATLENLKWIQGGRSARGAVMPTRIDFSTIEGGCDSHPVVAKLLAQSFPEDIEISTLIDYILAQPQRFNEEEALPGWEGLVILLRGKYSHREDDVLECFKKYPKMRLVERYELGSLMLDIGSLEELKNLKESAYQKWFAFPINLAIRTYGQRIKNGLIGSTNNYQLSDGKHQS